MIGTENSDRKCIRVDLNTDKMAKIICCSIVEHRIEKRETQQKEEEDIRFELWKENERNHWFKTEKKEL